MDDRPLSILHYLPVSPRDEQWGIVRTTAGHQHVPPGDASYSRLEHPEHYLFYSSAARSTSTSWSPLSPPGGGTEPASCPSQTVEAGTMLLLFPNEWHSYSPDPGTGWTEWWVGFRGANIDRLERGSFSRRRSRFFADRVQRRHRAVLLRDHRHGRGRGIQPLISSIVLIISGVGALQAQQPALPDNPVVEKINRAKAIMRTDFGRNRSPEQIAREVGMGYTWFRRVFREYVGMAPAQYQHTMRLNKARELLATTAHSISEIAYALGFESVSAFSLFFRLRERLSPSQYRARFRGEKGQ